MLFFRSKFATESKKNIFNNFQKWIICNFDKKRSLLLNLRKNSIYLSNISFIDLNVILRKVNYYLPRREHRWVFFGGFPGLFLLFADDSIAIQRLIGFLEQNETKRDSQNKRKQFLYKSFADPTRSCDNRLAFFVDAFWVQ